MVLMTLYADDLHLTKPIKDARDYISLQEDITAIANHIEKLHLAPQSVSVSWGQEKDGLFSLFKNYPSVVSSCQIERVTNWKLLLPGSHSEPTHLMVWTHPTPMWISAVQTWADTFTLRTVYLTHHLGVVDLFALPYLSTLLPSCMHSTTFRVCCSALKMNQSVNVFGVKKRPPVLPPQEISISSCYI